MNDTIHVSGMRGIESLLPGMRKQVSNTKSNISYKDMHVPLQTNAADVATSPENVTAKITADMTMDEYMNYIYDKISELPLHSTQLNRSASVFISDEGFAAMKKDPEYEDWVLGKLREDFAVCNPISAIQGSYTVYRFGAKKSDYHGDSWYDEFQSGRGKQVYRASSQGSFWNTHAAEQKRILALHNVDVREQKRISAELERDRITTDASREIARANRQNSIPVALSSYDMNSVLFNMPQMGTAETITTKRFMPDGTVITTTKKDGKIVEQSKKKPHLVPVTDGLTGEVKLEPYQSIFELI